MAYDTSLSLDLSDRLLTAKRKIHYLHTRLIDTKDTLRAHQRVQAGKDSDFYYLDQDTWTVALSGVGTGKEPLVDSCPLSGLCLL
jgi:hypothetical protein